MDPMFLPEVEGNPKESAYKGLIEQMQKQGAEYPQIWHLFAYLPRRRSTWRASRRRSCAARRRSAPACVS